MTIDAHHHFWHYTPAEYGWIDDPALRRDFTLDDLRAQLRAAGVDAALPVQARQTLEETTWLLDLAETAHELPGVVGWVPLCDPQIERVLASLAHRPKLRGVRHVLQGEADDRFMLRDDFDRGIAALRPFGLAYDVLIFPRHLPHAVTLADRHPEQRFVVDHLAKPDVAGGRVEPWRSDLREIAKRPNVYCKLAGGVVEADPRGWTPEALTPYFDAALDAFGPGRLMFGSNWPLTEVAGGYGRWLDAVRAWAAPLSPAERDRLFGATAAEAYHLPRSS